MLVRDFYKTREDGVNLYITFSDEDKFIRKKGTNEFYEDAIDVEDTPYEYTETNEIIIPEEKEEKIEEENPIKIYD